MSHFQEGFVSPIREVHDPTPAPFPKLSDTHEQENVAATNIKIKKFENFLQSQHNSPASSEASSTRFESALSDDLQQLRLSKEKLREALAALQASSE